MGFQKTKILVLLSSMVQK